MFFFVLCLAAAPVSHAMPPYVRTALNSFRPEVSREWAYTLMTARDGRETTERFNPSLPPAEQWALLGVDGRPPTAQELSDYFKHKASQAPGAMRATFQAGDIEPGTVELLHEDDERADFTCAFREQAAITDKMLGHLRLKLTVNKRQPHVEKSVLELMEPYSPVIGVKMRELVVTMNFSAPAPDRPTQPETSSSHFLGRVLLFPVQEDISFKYSDFTKVP